MHERTEAIEFGTIDMVLIKCPGTGNRHTCNHCGEQAKGKATGPETLFNGKFELPPAIVLIDVGLSLRPVIKNTRALARVAAVTVLISIISMGLIPSTACTAVCRNVCVDGRPTTMPNTINEAVVSVDQLSLHGSPIT